MDDYLGYAITDIDIVELGSRTAKSWEVSSQELPSYRTFPLIRTVLVVHARILRSNIQIVEERRKHNAVLRYFKAFSYVFLFVS